MPCGFKSRPFLLSTITWVKPPSWVSCCICSTLSLWIINLEGLGVRWIDKCLERCLRLASRLYGPHSSGTRQGNNSKLPWVEPDAQTGSIQSRYLAPRTAGARFLADSSKMFNGPVEPQHLYSPLDWNSGLLWAWSSPTTSSIPECLQWESPVLDMVFSKATFLAAYLLGHPVENYK